MTRSSSLTAVAVLLATVLLATGCSGGGEAETANPGRPGPAQPLDTVIRINLAAEPDSIDPGLNTTISGSKLLRHLFEGLVRLDADCNPEPGTAVAWEHDEDASTWTFTLRDDAVWSNGDPVTAGDFVFAYRRNMHPDTASQYAYFLTQLIRGGEEFLRTGEGEVGVEAVDDKTLRLVLSGPTPGLLQKLGHPIWYPQHPPTVREHGDAWANSPATYVSNGPYTLARIAFKDRYVLAKSERYHAADEVFFQEIVFRLISEPQTEVSAFETGELDITNSVPLAEIDRWRNRPEYFQTPYLGVYYITFNMTRPPFDDPALREAVTLAINRTPIVERITKRGETPATGFVPPGILLPDGTDYREIAGDIYDNSDYQANAARARQVLEDAGFGTARPLPRATYLYNNEAEEHRRIGEVMQQLWRSQLGLDVELESVEFKVRIQRGREKNYQFLRAGWIGDYPDPLTFLDIFITDGGNNDTGMANPRYDALIQQARVEPDPVRKFELCAEAERILLLEEFAVAPIYFYVEPLLVQTDIQGVMRNMLGDLDVSRARRVAK